MLTTLAIFDLGMTGHWIVYSLLGIGYGGANAGSGTSILTFVIVYFNVRLIHTLRLHERVTKQIILIGIVLYLFGLAVCGTIHYLGQMLPGHQPFSLSYWLLNLGHSSGYNAPHVIIMAIAGLLLFMKYVTVPRRIANAITLISPLMFGVYILHETTSFGRLMYRIPQAWLASHTSLHPFSIILATALFCFALCITIESVRRIITAPFNRFILDKLNTLDERLGLTTLH